MPESKWTEQELTELRALDRETARLVGTYLGGPIRPESPFVPTGENLAQLNSEIQRLLTAVGQNNDPFWRRHLTAALESLAFQVECNTKMPYEHITRISSGLDRLMGQIGPAATEEQVEAFVDRLKTAASIINAVAALVDRGSDLAKSQVADVLPPLVKNLERAIILLDENLVSRGAQVDAGRYARAAAESAKQLQSQVRSAHVGTMTPVDIPFSVSVEKGMQASLDYVLSWYEGDVEARQREYLTVAREDFPGKDPSQVLRAGGGYSTVEALFADMRSILDRLQEECKRFVDLPEGEHCEIGFIPETWRMMVPGFMYMGGYVAINPDNLGSYHRAGLETTAAHEVYPGHHVHGLKSRQHALPHTFRLGLFWSRCLQEGMCDRSMVLMTPYFQDPAARLSVANRLWFTANRVKAEVDIYYNKKSVQSVIDNYVKNMGLPVYNAEAQTRAHLMRPADAVSYYTGMKYLDELYLDLNMDVKAFTNEIFSYGSIPLATQKMIFELPEEKRTQIKTFTA